MDEKGLQELADGDPVRDSAARRVAREEVASLCGLVLRRLRSDPEVATAAGLEERLRSVFAEALRDFGGESAPGPVVDVDPGDEG